MPFFLPPLSRRRFLAGSVAAGLGLVSRRAIGASLSYKPVANNTLIGADRLALISDPHINADLACVHHGVCMADNFRQVTNQILALDHAPRHVLINGDLAHLRGRPGDYTAAVNLLTPFRRAGLPIHVAMGNHDSRAQFRAALPTDFASSDLPCDRHVTLLQLPRANVLMLDSLRTTNRMRGALGGEQLDWLSTTLDAHPLKPAVVMVHHPPELGFSLVKGGIADTSELFQVLSPRRQVKALIYGHTHVWSHKQQSDGLHLVNLPATAYTFGFGQPNGWVDALLDSKGATLQLHALDPDHSKNGERLRLNWRA